jgi:ribonuclease HI
MSFSDRTEKLTEHLIQAEYENACTQFGEKSKGEEKSENQVEVEQNIDSITIYTDGACSGNPGRGGFGAVILAGSKEYKLSGGEKLTTNNRMELMAAIEALEMVTENPLWKNANITLISDSQYVKNGIQSWIYTWKKNGWRTANKEPVKNKDLWLELDELSSQLKISWQWVKGHAGNKYNEICDDLAVTAAKNIK